MTDKPTKKTKTIPTKGKAAPVKIRTDWEAVERDYRTAKFTLIELAAKYACTHQAIGNQIKRHKWTQDLSIAIKQATDAKLVNDLVAKEVAKGGQEVANTVLMAAEINTQVILGHRTGLKRITKIQQKLLDQIEQAASNLPELEEVIEMIRNPDENGTDKANDQMRKAMSRSSLVDDLKKLSEIDEKVRKGEREAFNLNAEQTPDSEITSLLKSLGSRSAFQVVK
jgi:predicted DNA-binding protein YlxM (UPF0122 family)